MDEQTNERFEARRAHLRHVASRMLGNAAEADDAVQEAWLNVRRSGAEDVANLDGFLTTVVARVCLDKLRARKAKREQPFDVAEGGGYEPADTAANAEQTLLFSDSLNMALLVVLETLSPAERIAFVLHDMFDLPFDEIAPIVGRDASAARQLASRARRRVQGAQPSDDAVAKLAEKRTIVDAFMLASGSGDLAGLLAVLDPNVVFQADATAVDAAARNQNRGAPDIAAKLIGGNAVAAAFKGRAQGGRPALIDGVAGMAWAPGGKAAAVFIFDVVAGKITGIDLVADPNNLAEMEIVLLP